jgi:hypothetical protein
MEGVNATNVTIHAGDGHVGRVDALHRRGHASRETCNGCDRRVGRESKLLAGSEGAEVENGVAFEVAVVAVMAPALLTLAMRAPSNWQAY